MFKPLNSRVLSMALTGLIAASVAASAQPAAAPYPTLAAVVAHNQLACGVNPRAPGFSLPDSRGDYKGMNIDLCRAIAAAVLGDPTKIKIVPVTAVQRFPALQSGEVDVLTWNSTLTMSRDTAIGLEFSGVNFYDGQSIIVRRSMHVSSAKQLDGAAICMEPGTTTEVTMADYARVNKFRFTPILIDSTDQVVSAFLSGRCDAYTSDASQLAGLRATALGNPDDFVILPELLSQEPLGPMVRQGDEVWAKIVKWTMMAQVAAEETGVTQANADDLAKTSANPDIRRLLGTEGDLGKPLGLSAQWALRAIKAAGNYGESFDRNIGSGSEFKLDRGLNRLWTKGGLMYAIPLQ